MDKMTEKTAYLIFKDDTASSGVIEEAEGQEVPFHVRSRLLPPKPRECTFLNFTSSVANVILPLQSEHLSVLLVTQFKFHH